MGCLLEWSYVEPLFSKLIGVQKVTSLERCHFHECLINCTKYNIIEGFNYNEVEHQAVVADF